MNLYREVVGISWFLFVAAWVVLAMVFGGGGSRNYSSLRFSMRIFIIIGIVLGILSGSQVTMPSFGIYSREAAAAGVVLCIAGLLFATWARIVLGRNWGMPMSIHADPELITSGPYHYVRHPIYTGFIVMWIGTLLVYPSTILPAVGVILYSLVSAVREERDMARRFPGAYPEYRKCSKMLLPFLI